MGTIDDKKVQAEIERKAALMMGNIYSHPHATPPERIPAGFAVKSGARGPTGNLRKAGQLAQPGFFMHQMRQVPFAGFDKLMHKLPDYKLEKPIIGYKDDLRTGRKRWVPGYEKIVGRVALKGQEQLWKGWGKLISKSGAYWQDGLPKRWWVQSGKNIGRIKIPTIARDQPHLVRKGVVHPGLRTVAENLGIVRKVYGTPAHQVIKEYTPGKWEPGKKYKVKVPIYGDPTAASKAKLRHIESMRTYKHTYKSKILDPSEARRFAWKNIVTGNSFGNFMKGNGMTEVQRAAKAFSDRGGLFNIRNIATDAAVPITQARMNYINLASKYMEMHGGGIIGDNIKGWYFNAGYGTWKGLTHSTIDRKRFQGKWDPKKGKKLAGTPIQTVNVPVPLWGVTYRGDLPYSWKKYTYKWGNYPAVPGGINAKNPVTAALVTQASHRHHPAAMKGMESGFMGKGEKFWWSEENFVPSPENLNSSLMDITATLHPIAFMRKPTKWVGVKKWEAAAKRAEFGKELENAFGEISFYGVFEPYSAHKSVFIHEIGRGHRPPQRQFLTPGLRDGLNEVQRLGKVYVEDDTINVKEHIRIASPRMMRSIDYWSRQYQDRIRAGGPTVGAFGNAGLEKLPHIWEVDLNYDNLIGKLKKERSLMSKFFGNRMMWWFMPPSKYWHYIGMASDIKNIFFGGFLQSGAVYAMILAMAKGLAGARLGSPVPFTPKARRRKFRKGLYSRAGYHRKYVGMK